MNYISNNYFFIMPAKYYNSRDSKLASIKLAYVNL